MPQMYARQLDRTQSDGTQIWTTGYPFAELAKVSNCLCPDGRRRTVYATGSSDTFFSIPATVHAKGKHVAGYLTSEEWHYESLFGMVYHSRMVFKPYHYGKNASVFVSEGDIRKCLLNQIRDCETTKGYLDAALWSTNDESDDSGGCPLDANYSTEDCSTELLRQAIDDCKAFLAKFRKSIEGDRAEGKYPAKHEYGRLAVAGHDLWLTRNGHGAGFGDGHWRDSLANRMADYARKLGNVDLYVGDDGMIYS